MNALPYATILLSLIISTSAQYGGYGGGGYGGYGGGSSGYGGGSSSSNGGDLTTLSSFLGIDASKTHTILVAHGVLASLAFVIFFPVGAIAIRILPGRLALYVHAIIQILAYLLYIAGFGLGIWMARTFRFGGFSFFNNHHPIIGIVIFALLFFQPILGVIHHTMFKKYQRRTIWSYGHLWLGRGLIVLGIVNGGLGLELANNTSKGKIAYGVVAGVFGLAWIIAAVVGEARGGRDQTAYADSRHGSRHHRRRRSRRHSRSTSRSDKHGAEFYA